MNRRFFPFTNQAVSQCDGLRKGATSQPLPT